MSNRGRAAAKKTAASKNTQKAASKSAPRREEEANASEENEEEMSADSADVDDDDPEEIAAQAKQWSDTDDDDEDEDEEEDEDEDLDSATPADASSNGGTSTPEKIDRRKLKKGPRQVFFTCAAFVENIGFDDAENGMKKGDSDLVQVEIMVTMPPKAKDFFDVKKARQEASDIFEEKYGVPPRRISVPSYAYLGEQKKPSTPRDSIKTEKLAPFTGVKGEAIHHVKGVPWKVAVNFTKKADEAFILYKTPAVKLEKKMQRPQPRGIYLRALKDLKIDSETTESNETQTASN